VCWDTGAGHDQLGRGDELGQTRGLGTLLERDTSGSGATPHLVAAGVVARDNVEPELPESPGDSLAARAEADDERATDHCSTRPERKSA
jgi:hypothetical protein